MTNLKKRKKSKGQGMVEYAGALVVAAVIVAAVLALGPDAIGALWTAVIDAIVAFFTGEVAGL